MTRQPAMLPNVSALRCLYVLSFRWKDGPWVGGEAQLCALRGLCGLMVQTAGVRGLNIWHVLSFIHLSAVRTTRRPLLLPRFMSKTWP